uniref:Rho GTPase-activating protein 19 n=1 Tax=Lygus hesperus TaxID=30085 RepID=A0A0A9Z8Y1_LYGHE
MYYPAYCQIADLCSGDQSVNQSTRVLRSLQLLFLLLPRENRRLLKNLLRLLHLTASHEDSNRMSPQNIATLFTPHLLCSRKLSPEVFHSTAANLSCVVVFMINESTSTFGIPEALATDIHAYWEGKRKNTFLERSISEAKTVFSFTDRELSQREDAVNPTETALAQLYAHIQGLPESSHKKRLIKQFNKENGNGTPRTKSLGISIKKHIFSKNAKAKGYTDYLNLKNSGMSSSHHSLLNSPERKMPRTPLTAKLRLNLGSCSDQKRSPSVDDELGEDMTTDDSLSTTGSLTTTPPPSPVAPPPIATGNFDSPRRHWPTPDVLTSTPAVCPSANTPVGPPDDMSPITRSAQRMPKAMQVKLSPIVVEGRLGDGASNLLRPPHHHDARTRSDDNAEEQETCGCSERLKPLPARKLDLGDEGPIVGTQSGNAVRKQAKIGRREDGGCGKREWEHGGEWGGLADVTVQGLPFQPQRPHRLSRRSQLLIPNGGFRPLVIRRRHRCPALGLTPVLPRRGVSIIDQEFWHPPKEGPLLGRCSDEWEEVRA